MNLNLRLLKEARHVKKYVSLSILLGSMGGIFSILQARQLSRVLNDIFLKGETLESVVILIFSILLIVILRAASGWGSELSAGTAARHIKQGLRQELFLHIQELGPAYLKSDQESTSNHTGELVNLATEGIDALEAYYSQYLPQIALAAIIPIAILAFVFPSDLISGIIFLVTAPLIPLFMVLIGSAAQALTIKQWKGLSRMSAYFLDVVQGLTTLKTLGRSKDQVGVIKNVSEHYRQTTMSVLKVTFLSAFVLELIATLSTAVIAVEIGIRLLYGGMAFEQAFFILLLAPEFYLPLRLLGTRFHAGMAGVEAAKRIYEILDIPVHGYESTHDGPATIDNRRMCPPGIIFNDVEFAYAKDSQALHGVSFEIPAGKMSALTGESGAGKTTLTWLLLGFLRAQQGQITIDGIPLGEIPVELWREQLAWVPQSPYLLNDTLGANIKLAKPGASLAEVQHAARLAHASEFIARFPQGYETIIGERGIRLSAGQAQRIALARAFLKDAPVLILDEATSHLDPETDMHLQEAMATLTQGRTVLVIAHHLSTIARADHVIELSRGRVMPFEKVERQAAPIPADHEFEIPSSVHQTTDEIIPTPAQPVHQDVQESFTQPVELRLLSLLSPFWGRILLSIFLGFATIASSISLMATAAYIISAAALQPSIAELQVAIVGVRFFGLSRGVFRYLERLVSHDVTFRLLARWRVAFYRVLEPLAPARLMGFHSGDLLSRVIRDIGSLESFYIRTVSPPLVALLVGTTSLLFLGGYGPELAWGSMGFLILAGAGLPLLIQFLSRRIGVQIIQVRSELSILLVDGLQGMADLLIFDQAGSHAKKVKQAGERLTRLQASMAGIHALQNALGGLIANLGMLAVLILAIQRVSHGQLDGVFLGVVTLVALTSFEAMQPLPQAAQTFEINRAAAKRLYQLVDTKPAVVDQTSPLPVATGFDIEVQNLSFRYPDMLEPAEGSKDTPFELKDISFSVPLGKHIALIGPSGAGKTTLISLLLRFWEYQYGSILLDHRDLRHYAQDDIRNRIAIVSQNTYLFSATIRDNLLIARPQARDEEIIQAAKNAQMDDFIQSLPEKYDTWIGEHGLRLSAGERQRLAIARALLKDVPLLILDEPTANLDADTELAVLNSIHNISQGQSTITITQRMVGLENMDEILILKNGRIIERGRQAELLSQQGYFKRMWDVYHQII